MPLKRSFTHAVAISLPFCGVANAFLGVHSARLDVDVQVTYDLSKASKTSITATRALETDVPFYQTYIGEAPTAYQTIDESSHPTIGPYISPTTESDFLYTTTTFSTGEVSTSTHSPKFCSSAITGAFGDGWSIPSWPSIGGHPKKSSITDQLGTEPDHTNSHPRANDTRVNAVPSTTPSAWPTMVSAAPLPGNYTGFKSPAAPSISAESSGTHVSDWSVRGLVITLLYAIALR